MIYAFTSAAVNYLPKVRLLCRSIKRHHPEFRVALTLVDSIPAWLDLSSEPFDEIITVDSLGIRNLKSWLFQHSIVELCTAVKPFALGKLMERDDCSAVLYFDPDMVIFSRLDDLLQDLSQANLALTPHQTVPESNLEAVIDNEICSLKHGIYNLGFIAVRNTSESKKFAQWWSDRLYHFCRADIGSGLFTDQRWIDFAPVFFEGVNILKSPRFNVATWNLTTRKFTGDRESGYYVDGYPLGFYHFTGFDKGDHRIMANKNAPGNASVMELINWYEKETSSIEYALPQNQIWSFGVFSDGSNILPVFRQIYRMRLDLQKAYPDPFDLNPDSECYYNWLMTAGKIDFPDLLKGINGSSPIVTNYFSKRRRLVRFLKRSIKNALGESWGQTRIRISPKSERSTLED